MIKQHESSNSFEYDWIVRLRPDIIYSPLGPEAFDPKYKISLPEIPDSIPLSNLRTIFGVAVYRFF